MLILVTLGELQQLTMKVDQKFSQNEIFFVNYLLWIHKKCKKIVHRQLSLVYLTILWFNRFLNIMISSNLFHMTLTHNHMILFYF